MSLDDEQFITCDEAYKVVKETKIDHSLFSITYENSEYTVTCTQDPSYENCLMNRWITCKSLKKAKMTYENLINKYLYGGSMEIIKQDHAGDYFISTAFLGTHGEKDYPFETKVQYYTGEWLNDKTRNYITKEEAEKGHEVYVKNYTKATNDLHECLAKGIEDARAGRTTSLGSFAEFLEDDEK